MPIADARPTRRERRERREQSIPSLSPLENIVGQLAIYRDQLEFMQRIQEAKGDIFRFRFAVLPVVLISHPDHVHHVLVENHENYDKDTFFFRVGRVALRDGLVVNPGGESWRQQRKLMNPSFHRPSVALIARNITDLTEERLREWESRLDQDGGIDIYDMTREAGNLAVKIVVQSLFGVDMRERTDHFIEDFLQINMIFGNFFRCPFPPLSWRRKLRVQIRKMDGFVADLIRKRLQEPAEQQDLFSMLFNAIDEETGRKLTERQLAVEILNMLLAGYETTTLALSWLFYYIADHPAVQRRIQAEVDEVLGQRVPAFEDLPKLTYTRMVVDEILRLCPPAWQTTRHAVADDEIDGYFIPAGTNLNLNIFMMHRHPQFWSNPTAFDPDRFSRQEVAARPRQAYQPFGSGPRHCLGKHFALTELHLITAMIAQVFHIARPAGLAPVKFSPLATLHPSTSIHLRLQRR
jgi:cytochrome P450